jgi:hypothetical protein
MEEARLVIEEEDRKHFAEVVFADIKKQWYVQKRIDCVPNTEVTEEQVCAMVKLGRKYGFGDIGSLNGNNYGAKGKILGHNFTVNLSGVPVIYDYGR